MRKQLISASEWLLAAVFIIGACNLGGESGQLIDGPVTDTCSTGLYWEGGDAESELMRPGGDCISCHTERGEGPSFVAAGTVMGGLDEEDDCAGIADVTVEIIDADGNTHTTITNRAGNFFFDASLAIPTPYTARVTSGGRSVEMTTPQTETNCMQCHTATGANDAPGRITVP